MSEDAAEYNTNTKLPSPKLAKVRLHVYLPDGTTFEGEADIPAEVLPELSARGVLTANVVVPYSRPIEHETPARPEPGEAYP